LATEKQVELLLRQIEAQPRDVRLLQKLGELYQKMGDDTAAARVFMQVARLYADERFFLKAIALAKQVHKLDPGNVQAIEWLEQWHTKLGLESEATAYRKMLTPKIMGAG
jgi:hypothetical protein